MAVWGDVNAIGNRAEALETITLTAIPRGILTSAAAVSSGRNAGDRGTSGSLDQRRWRGLTRPDPDRLWREAEANIQAGRATEAYAALGRLESLRSATPEDWLLRAQVSAHWAATTTPLTRSVTFPMTTLWRPRPGSWPGGSNARITGSGTPRRHFVGPLSFGPGWSRRTRNWSIFSACSSAAAKSMPNSRPFHG